MAQTEPDYVLSLDDSHMDNILVEQKGNKQRRLISNIFARIPNTHLAMGVLPPAVRSVGPLIDNKYRMILVEQKPQTVTVQVRGYKCFCEKHTTGESDKIHTMEIAVPWQHWVLTCLEVNGKLQVDRVCLFFSKTKIQSLDHEFYSPWLPNVFSKDWVQPSLHSSKTVCAPMPDGVYPLNDFRRMWNDVYRSFWHDSTFNADLWCNLAKPLGLIDSWSTMADRQGTEEEEDWDKDIKYDCVVDAMAQLQTPLQEILSSELFESGEVALNYKDYINYQTDKGNSGFDFRSLFEEALDVAQVVQMIDSKTLNFTWTGAYIQGTTTPIFVPVHEQVMQLDLYYDTVVKRWRNMKGEFVTAPAD